MNNLPSNILVLESYIAMLKNSVGIKMFQNFFIKDSHASFLNTIPDPHT